MKKALLLALCTLLGIVVLGGAAFMLLFAAPVAAQDATADPPAMPDPPALPDEPVVKDARDLLGDRAKTPDERETPDPQPGDNAGSFDSNIAVTRSETTETRSESTTLSIGNPADDDGFPKPGSRPSSDGWGTPGGNNGASPIQLLSGRWKLASVEGTDNCNITLQSAPWSGGYRAMVPAGCPKDFFDVNRWDLTGNEIRLSTSFGKLIATFYRAGSNHFNGVRESDGARMTLAR